jgi:subtilisin family serine protease
VRRLPFLAALIALAVPAPARAQDEIVVLRGADRPVGTEIDQRERALGFEAEHEYDRVIDGFAADLTDAQVDRLEADPEVAMVVPNRPVTKSGVVSAISASGVPPGVNRVTQTLAGTVRQKADGAVAVLDTGVDLDHPDLDVAAGKNCIDTAAPPDDVDGHGTHVAGIIGARNDAQGVVGVAPGTRIVAVKVLDDEGDGSTATILCGAEWVLANAAARNITVANFSLGGSGGASTCASDPEHAVFCRLADARITPVVAAGNAGSDFGVSATREVPAAYPQVLTVSAMTDTDGKPGGLGAGDRCTGAPDDRYASFSNFATRADDEAHLVAAPGTCIRSTSPGGRYARMSGTSMAAPHVAALVALCKGENGTAGPCRDLTTPQVVARMRITSAWTAFTGMTGRRFGPLAVLSDPSVPTPEPTPIVEEEPAGQPAPAPVAVAPAPPPAPAPPRPAPAPAVTPVPPPAPPIRSSRPSLSLVTPRLATLRTRGITIRLACPGECSGLIRLRVTKATARRLKLKSTTLATAWPEGSGTVRLRLGRTVRRRLARTRKALRVELVVELDVETALRPLRSTKKLTIRR